MKTTLKLTIIFFILMSIQSCYKRKDKETIRGTITCLDTVNNVGINGVKFIIYEYKEKIKDTEKIVFIEGETDQNGKATFEFERPKNKKKWGYDLVLDVNTFPSSFIYNYVKGNNEIPLYNVYNEYEGNDITINFYH